MRSRPSPLALRHVVHHVPDEQRHQVVSGVVDPVDDDRCGVPDLPLELPHHPVRLGHDAAFGRLADQHGAVRRQVQDRRDLRRTAAEVDDLRTGRTALGRSA